MTEPKETLHHYLRQGRDALAWKLEGLTERQLRWPMTPTGTNLLGLVKHVASMEYGYLGDVFGRPAPEPMPWLEPEATDNDDMWATTEQSKEWVLGFYRRAQAHADQTVAALDLDAVGEVPWWGEGRRRVTLHQILVHLTVEVSRHAGQADIVRELTDGGRGLAERNDNLPKHEEDWWTAYRAKLQQVASSFE